MPKRIKHASVSKNLATTLANSLYNVLKLLTTSNSDTLSNKFGNSGNFSNLDDVGTRLSRKLQGSVPFLLAHLSPSPFMFAGLDDSHPSKHLLRSPCSHLRSLHHLSETYVSISFDLLQGTRTGPPSLSARVAEIGTAMTHYACCQYLSSLKQRRLTHVEASRFSFNNPSALPALLPVVLLHHLHHFLILSVSPATTSMRLFFAEPACLGRTTVAR